MKTLLPGLPPTVVKPDSSYFGVRCSDCWRPILLHEDPARVTGDELMVLSQPVQVVCAACGEVTATKELGRCR